MKKYNVIVIFNKELVKILMCKRTKEPYIGMYNLVGGKIEKENLQKLTHTIINKKGN